MTERYREELIKKNLKEEYDLNLTKGKKGDTILKIKRKEFSIPSSNGWIYDSGIDKITKIVKDYANKQPTEIYAKITKEPQYGTLERIAIKPAIILFSLGFLFFLLEKMKITGFIISNVSDSTLSIGIFVCASITIILYLLQLSKYRLF
jgi:hypothetical protein